MNKAVICLLVCAALVGSLEAVFNRCEAPAPQGTRAEFMWTFDGRNCIKLPAKCYDLGGFENIYRTNDECRRTCDKDSPYGRSAGK